MSLELTSVGPSGDDDTRDRTSRVSSVKPTKMGKAKVKSILGEYQFWRAFGFSGAFLFLLLITMPAGNFFFLTIYARRGTRGLQRPLVWVFLVTGSLLTVHMLVKLFKLKRDTYRWIFRKYSASSMRSIRSSRNGRNCLLQRYRQYIDLCGLDGTYYLVRLYLNEFRETCYRVFNLATFYFCLLPMSVTTPLMCIMLAENLNRIFFFSSSLRSSRQKILTVGYRNNLIYFDCFIDYLSLVVPVSIMRFQYDISMTPEEIVVMMVPPSIFLHTKLNRMLIETVRRNVESEVLDYQSSHSSTRSLSREDVFGPQHGDIVAGRQNRHLTKKIRRIIFSVSVFLSILLSATLLVQLIRLRELDRCDDVLDKRVWDSCVLKVPFCQHPYEPSCDCAVLKMKGYNSSKLPSTFTIMNNLRKIAINGTMLETFPTGAGDAFPKLTNLEVTNSRLHNFTVDVRNWAELTEFDLEGNLLSSVHESVWLHPRLTNVFLQRNRGLELPEMEQVYLPNLIFLIYSENNVTIPLDFFHADRFPNLGNLFINGNNLEDFPPSIESLKNNMAALGIARTGIRNLPSFIAELKGLHYIDARDNKISIVDGAVEEFFRERKPNQAYFSGNEICETAAKEYLDCEPLCSKYCFSRYSQDKNCDLGCYTKACEYDGGVCDL